MGTPELSLVQAIGLFAKLGLDGLEVICCEGYKCGVTLRIPTRDLRGIKRRAADQGLVMVGLVPYTKDLDHPEQVARRRAITQLKMAVDLALALECPSIRILAGREASAAERPAALQRLVDALSEVGEYARAAGTQLNVENHMDTMATSAAATMEIIRAMNSPNVGVLYDQANLSHLRQESPDEAIALQWPYIRHVHVKDFYWRGEERRATLLGQGIVPWRAIVDRLRVLGYDGYYSLEYERRWFPDQLPPAEIGMRRGVEFLRGIV